jgi:tRNA U55 pseudouridine synthase TruB
VLQKAPPPEREALAREKLFSMERAVETLPRLTISAAAAEGVRHGRVPSAGGAPAGLLALFDEAGRLLAVARANGKGGLELQRVFSA